MDRLKELYESRAKLDADSKRILDVAEADSRALSAEEQENWDKFDKEISACTAEIQTREKQAARDAELAASRGRQVPPVKPGVEPKGEDEPQEFRASGGRTIPVEPGSALFSRSASEYTKAFRGYLSGVGGTQAGLQTASDIKGGYLAPTAFLAQVIQAVDDAVFMRQLCTVLPPLDRATSLGCPSLDTDLADADWTAEVPAADISEDDAIEFGTRELTPHLLTKLVKVSEKLLRSSIVSADAIVAQRIAYKFGITEEKGFLTGTGAQQPLGIFVASDDGIPTTRNVTAAAGTSFTADNLIDMVAKLKSQYQANATWIVHPDFITRVRKLKSGLGDYLWQPGLAGTVPATILGRPYVQSENAPNTFTSALYVAVLADFKAGYWIVDALELAVQRLEELFALKNQVGFKAQKETDGMPVLSEAFARLIMA